MQANIRTFLMSVVLCLSIFILCGCPYLTSQYENTRGDIYEIKVQVGRLQALQGDTHNLLNSYISEERQRDQANLSKLTARQSDVDRQISELREEIRKLKSLIEEMRFAIGMRDSYPRDESTEATLNKEERKIPIPVSELVVTVDGETVDGAALLKSAHDDLARGKYDAARSSLQKFLQYFSTSKPAEDALFSLGDTYFYEKKYEDALTQYQSLSQAYPSGLRAPDSLVKSAICLINLGRKSEARDTLNRVVREFPSYGDIQRVKDLLKGLNEK